MDRRYAALTAWMLLILPARKVISRVTRDEECSNCGGRLAFRREPFGHGTRVLGRCAGCCWVRDDETWREWIDRHARPPCPR